jgi:hypothetical protein
VVRQARRDRRCRSERPVTGAEVVERKVKHQRRPVMLPLLREASPEAVHPLHECPHREILALDMGGANPGQIGPAVYGLPSRRKPHDLENSEVVVEGWGDQAFLRCR